MGEQTRDNITEYTDFTCNLCGARYEDKAFAESCRNSHFHFNDLRVVGVALDPGEMYAFPPGHALPDKLILRGGNTDVIGVYMLRGVTRKKKPVSELTTNEALKISKGPVAQDDHVKEWDPDSANVLDVEELDRRMTGGKERESTSKAGGEEASQESKAD